MIRRIAAALLTGSLAVTACGAPTAQQVEEIFEKGAFSRTAFLREVKDLLSARLREIDSQESSTK